MKELDFWRIEQRLAKNSSATEHEIARNYGWNVGPRRWINNQITIFER